MKLVFQLEKNELMNKRIVAPHSELNPEIYADVDSIVSRNPVEDLSISIYTAPVSEALQNKIREIFREHYDDEYNTVRKEIQKVSNVDSMLCSRTPDAVVYSISGCKYCFPDRPVLRTV